MLEDEIGDIIAKARLGQGISSADLSDATGLTKQYISEVEACRLTPGSEPLYRLAEALSLDPGRLVAIAAGWMPGPVSLPQDQVLVERVKVPVGGYEENCYIIGCPKTRLTAVVDPGGAIEEINGRLASIDLELDLVMLTHAHADHVAGLKQLLIGRPSARLVNHQLERDSVINGLSNPWLPAKESVAISLGNLTVTPLFTPGHTPGSTCYVVDGLCLVGDTLFSGSVGRPAGTQVYQEMLRHIRTKVLSLPDRTVLLPGHGPLTTVRDERSANPFF